MKVNMGRKGRDAARRLTARPEAILAMIKGRSSQLKMLKLCHKKAGKINISRKI